MKEEACTAFSRVSRPGSEATGILIHVNNDTLELLRRPVEFTPERSAQLAARLVCCWPGAGAVVERALRERTIPHAGDWAEPLIRGEMRRQGVSESILASVASGALWHQYLLNPWIESGPASRIFFQVEIEAPAWNDFSTIRFRPLEMGTTPLDWVTARNLARTESEVELLYPWATERTGHGGRVCWAAEELGLEVVA